MAPDPSIPIGDSFVGLGSKGWDGGSISIFICFMPISHKNITFAASKTTTNNKLQKYD